MTDEQSTKGRMALYARRIQSAQSRMLRLQREIKARIEEMQKEVERSLLRPLRKQFPGIDARADFMGGSMTDEWTPNVYVSGPDGARLARRKGKVIGWYVGRRKAECGIDGEVLVAECLRMSSESGVEIQPWWADVDPDGPPLSLQDLVDMHGEESILEKGEILTKGWEGIDEWAIARIEGQIHLFVFGMGHRGEVEDPEEFFSKIEEDDDNEAVRGRWQQNLQSEKSPASKQEENGGTKQV